MLSYAKSATTRPRDRLKGSKTVKLNYLTLGELENEFSFKSHKFAQMFFFYVYIYI